MAEAKRKVVIGSGFLRIDDVLAVAAGDAGIKLDESPQFIRSLEKSVEHLDKLIESGTPVYGVTTGFGASCENAVASAHSVTMAANLVRFHGCGTGRNLDAMETAAVMVVRLASLAQGRSSVRPILLSRMCDMINRRLLPVIPSEGSVGASGDLTPLSYIAATLMGEREVTFKGRVVPTAKALFSAKLEPIELRPKESLALMNGTSVTCMMIAFSDPTSRMNWRIASRNGRPSMSPVVPPISVIMMSPPEFSPSSRILPLISSVMWGITWTVLPR